MASGRLPVLPGSIDVAAVFDAKHDDLWWFLADAVQDAVGTPPCRPNPGQLSAERLSYAERLSHQRSRQELDHRGGNRFGQVD